MKCHAMLLATPVDRSKMKYLVGGEGPNVPIKQESVLSLQGAVLIKSRILMDNIFVESRMH